MTIAGVGERCKTLVATVPRDVLILAILVLSASASFGLGYLTGRDQAVGKGGMTIEVIQPNLPPEPATTGAGAGPLSAQSSYEGAPQGSAAYVASKNGTKYYLPNCSGAKRISEANKVWFASPAAAVAAGYAPAANCKGL